MTTSAAVLTRPQTGVGVVQKFFAKCITEDWEEVILIARATSEAEASEKIHNGYRVMMVMDILTEDAHMMERLKLRKSLTGRPQHM